MKVGIIGASGYSGVELFRILNNHPNIEKCMLYSSSEVDNSYSRTFPHLNCISDHSLKKIEINDLSESLDVLFLATPPGVSASLTPALFPSRLKIIDLSGDLRLKKNSDYEQWYKRQTADEEILQSAVYGLPELNYKQIEHAKLIANPGCFPTASILGLAPITKESLIDEQSIIVDAKSGVSGAGRKASAVTSYAEINENLKIYKVNEHQHIPEIEQALHSLNDQINTITFSTHLIPMTRGIMATIYVKLVHEISTERLLDCYRTFYEHSPFVRIRNMNEFPSTKEVYGSNYCDIGLKVDERTGRVTIVSVIDNLMKGAAGQAVQNFNIMHGLNETTSLHTAPIFP
ncbi:N-acetyl-gamma-glutamyl-phosphate reductase [Metabacillus herbersteinensis]|uniref:N-acetyl-gamma-glutamyl-phosphate reductase n=1 Tax=Metabacillus herbersteinensis TaxID=283816 RepID=A0ABV6GEA3_9BACI